MADKEPEKDPRHIALAALESYIGHLEDVIQFTSNGLTAAQYDRLRELHKRIGRLL